MNDKSSGPVEPFLEWLGELPVPGEPEEVRGGRCWSFPDLSRPENTIIAVDDHAVYIT
jgi:hypothetical protein